MRRILVKFGGIMWEQSLRLQINASSKSRWALANALFPHFPVGFAALQACVKPRKGPSCLAKGRLWPLHHEASWRLKGGPGL